MNLDSLQVFYGDAHHAEARIYAHLPGPEIPEDVRLVGHVAGPEQAYTRTMREKWPLVDRGTVGGRLAEAIIADPCFWSAEYPFCYRVYVELVQAGTVIASTERLVGFRSLGIARGRLVFEGQPWTLKGAYDAAVVEATGPDWHASGLARLADEPNDALLADASRLGVWIVARTERRGSELAQELRRLAGWPAVAIVIAPPDAEIDATTLGAARNLLLAQVPLVGEGGAQPWCQLIVQLHTDGEGAADAVGGAPLPVATLGPRRSPGTLAAAQEALANLEHRLPSDVAYAALIV